jgi:phosphatidylglycerol---prolipoprotein diacylglyceryl transferase
LDPIVHNIDPFLFRIGDGFGVRWYSLPYILGMVLVWHSLRSAGRDRSMPGMTDEGAESFVLLAIVAALVGARFFHVFVFEFDRYGFRPLDWIAVWRGGLAFHGGLAGILLATAWFARKHGIPIYALTDRIAVPIAVALGLGRIANFINAEMYGTPYDGPFCVDYSQNEYMARPPEGCRHPTQLYESAKNFGMAGLLFLVRERAKPRPGVVTWAFVALYGTIRFLLMYLREERTVWMELTLSQVFSGLMGLLGAIMLVVVLRSGGPGDEAPVPRRTRPRRRKA